MPINTLLIISATILAAVRLTAYYNEELSREIAKLIPFTLLGVSLVSARFFDFTRVLEHLNQIPQFGGQIISYLIFIIALEIVLRVFEFLFSIFHLKEEFPKQEDSSEWF